jgi:EAL domain-containing protein (putative c-di-GMP-specific phosphodiesterase class I)
VRPRVELSSGRLGAVEVRAHRVDEDGAKIDAATDPSGPAVGEVADAIGELVMWAGLAVMRRLGDAGEVVDVAIVLPPAALAGEQIVERLADLAAGAGVDLARVCLSLPDARGASPAAAPLDVLTRLRVHGFGLGIDGFGAAHATLPELGQLPLTEVKIAAEAVARASASKRGAEAFTATAQALRDQGVNVVCDGCDTQAEFELAVQAGCRRAQGALVGPPMAPEHVGRWLATWTGVT